ncbi:class I SAM-dependent DNA methyltransferase [Maribacter sp. 2307UL18-2]|uniref:class I SAM-dependent DNA methyltransferase n=1 Tax=Maribacter sp. 2307UL18-2 TaxID=3386274 RepID=UPI0039BD719E
MSISNLYGAELAKVFDTMYQGFIAYDEEFQFYTTKAEKIGVDSILEIGCGTGNLARYLAAHFKHYLGIDLSEHMLQLAREKNPEVPFMQADMRNFSTEKRFDLALITGRSSSYLVSHTDLTDTFDAIAQALRPKAHLIFDCIDADRFIPYIEKNPRVVHNAKVGELKFRRNSYWHIENKAENLVNWTADYYKLEGIHQVKLGQDQVIFKAFTQNEMEALLTQTGYEVIHMEDRPSYAFDTFVVHAQKKR